MPDLVDDDNDNDEGNVDMNSPNKPPSPNLDGSSNHGVPLPQSPQLQPFDGRARKAPPGLSHIFHLTINGRFQFILLTSTYKSESTNRYMM